MHCPFCRTADTKVIDSRLTDGGSRIRRRRECPVCEERFNTFETAELTMPRVIKRDDSRENYDQDKLRSGFVKALEKRLIRLPNKFRGRRGSPFGESPPWWWPANPKCQGREPSKATKSP